VAYVSELHYICRPAYIGLALNAGVCVFGLRDVPINVMIDKETRNALSCLHIVYAYIHSKLYRQTVGLYRSRGLSVTSA